MPRKCAWCAQHRTTSSPSVIAQKKSFAVSRWNAVYAICSGTNVILAKMSKARSVNNATHIQNITNTETNGNVNLATIVIGQHAHLPVPVNLLCTGRRRSPKISILHIIPHYTKYHDALPIYQPTPNIHSFQLKLLCHQLHCYYLSQQWSNLLWNFVHSKLERRTFPLWGHA